MAKLIECFYPGLKCSACEAEFNDDLVSVVSHPIIMTYINFCPVCGEKITEVITEHRHVLGH